MDLTEFGGVIGGSGLIVAIVQFIRKVFPTMSDRVAPLVAMVAAILLEVYVAFATNHPLDQGVMLGVVIGLSAMGVYAGGRTTIEK